MNKTLEQLIEEKVKEAEEKFKKYNGIDEKDWYLSHDEADIIRQALKDIAEQTAEALGVKKKENFVDAWCAGYDAAVEAQENKRKEFFGE